MSSPLRNFQMKNITQYQLIKLWVPLCLTNDIKNPLIDLWTDTDWNCIQLNFDVVFDIKYGAFVNSHACIAILCTSFHTCGCIKMYVPCLIIVHALHNHLHYPPSSLHALETDSRC